MQTKPCFCYHDTHVLITTGVGERKHTGAAFLQSLRNSYALSEDDSSSLCDHSSLLTHCGPLANGYSGGMVASAAFKSSRSLLICSFSTSWELLMAGEEQAVPRPCSQIPVQREYWACLLCALSPSYLRPSTVSLAWIPKSGFITLVMYYLFFLYQITPKWLSWSLPHISVLSRPVILLVWGPHFENDWSDQLSTT